MFSFLKNSKLDKKEIKSNYNNFDNFPYPNKKLYKIIDNKCIEFIVIETRLNITMDDTQNILNCTLVVKNGNKTENITIDKVIHLDLEKLEKLSFNEENLTFNIEELKTDVVDALKLNELGYYYNPEDAKNAYNESILTKMIE